MGAGSVLGLCSKAEQGAQVRLQCLSCVPALWQTAQGSSACSSGAAAGGDEEHPESLQGEAGVAPALPAVWVLCSGPALQFAGAPSVSVHPSLQHRFFLPLCLCPAVNQGGWSCPSSLEGWSDQCLEQKELLRRFASSFTPSTREKPTWSCRDREAFQAENGDSAGLGLDWQKCLAGMLSPCKAAFFSGISFAVEPPSAS